MMPDIPEELQQQLKAMVVPKVEMVTREGKPTQIDDYDSFMQFLMLASIASQAVKIRRYFDDRESEGIIQNFNILVAAALPYQKIRVEPPAQSISLTNDGPGIVWIEWNRRHSGTTILNPGPPPETCNINFETHKLERFYIRCPAVASNIRAIAKG